MLRAGYVDVALVFRYSAEPPGADGQVSRAGRRDRLDDESGIDLTEGLREKLLLDEPVHLVTSASGHQARPGTAGRAGRLRPAPVDRGLRPLPGQPAQAVRARRVHPEDRVHHRRLRRGPGAGGRRSRGLHPAGAVPARRAAPGDQDRAAAGRPPVRVRGPVRRPARPARGEPAHGGAPRGGGAAAAAADGRADSYEGDAGSATVASVNPGPPPTEPAAGPGRLRVPGDLEPIPGQLALPGMPSAAGADGGAGGQPTLPGLEFLAADARAGTTGKLMPTRNWPRWPRSCAGSTGTGRGWPPPSAARWTCCSTASTPAGTGGTSCTRPRRRTPGPWWRSRWPASLRLADGAALDYTIAGADVDCKFSHRLGGWMIPPEADGKLMLLVQASDEDGTWSAGLLRAAEENLRPAGNRDGKRALSERGRAAVCWLHARAPLQENVLIRLPGRDVAAIFAAAFGAAAGERAVPAGAADAGQPHRGGHGGHAGRLHEAGPRRRRGARPAARRGHRDLRGLRRGPGARRGARAAPAGSR